MKNNVAIILARGGSKGLPGKNVKEFVSHPLVAWSIIQANHSKEINKVYLSSDCDEIISIGEEYKANIIKRPSNLAEDNSKSEDAILHAIDLIEDEFDTITMLEPTAPLRGINDIDNALKMFENKNWDSCFSGATLEDFLIWKKDKDENLISVNYDYRNQGPRQEREPDYVENGALYIFKPEVIKKNNNRFGGKIGLFPNHFWQSFEIDDLEGFNLCQLIFEHYLKSEYKNFIK
tara:strand:+ start:2893 stop:3594 length:702 start_codon:yes stop_codon:yes gene_type:complete